MATPRKRAPRAKSRAVAADQPAAEAKPTRPRRKKVVLAEDTATRFTTVPAQATERVHEQDIIADVVLPVAEPAQPAPKHELVLVSRPAAAPRVGRTSLHAGAAAALLLLVG